MPSADDEVRQRCGSCCAKGVARRSQPSPVVFTGNSANHAGVFNAQGQTPANFGTPNYTLRSSPATLDDIYRELDGSVAHHDGLNWQLRVLAIHEAGAERWIQLSATSGSVEHDLVLHMTPHARTGNVIASIEAWFDDASPTSRIIDVS